MNDRLRVDITALGLRFRPHDYHENSRLHSTVQFWVGHHHVSCCKV